jgi:hypothetical protein
LVSNGIDKGNVERNVRRNVCVKQNVTVLQVLNAGAHLEVFLQRVAALVRGGAEGSLVDAGHSDGEDSRSRKEKD